MPTIGLRDVHYAKLNADTESGATYATPKRLRGAISANVNPNASTATLFADDGPYESASTLGEISVELNLAEVPPEAQADILGHTYEGGLLVKKASDQPPYLALGYRSLKSNGAYRHVWLYKGKFTPSEQNNNTKGDSIEYQTPTIVGAFVKRDYDDAWQIEADSDDTSLGSGVISGWFEAVTDPNDLAGVLEAIAITTPATTLAYSVDESFNSAGMVVTATFDNGSSSVVPNGSLTITPSGGLALSDTSVTISYTTGGVTKTTTQAITVTE